MKNKSPKFEGMDGKGTDIKKLLLYIKPIAFFNNRVMLN
jgi:hypothetical protein